MKRLISFILVMIMCVSLLGTSAYAGLDMSSFDAFKAQAMGQAAPDAVSSASTAPSGGSSSDSDKSLSERLDELADRINSGKTTSGGELDIGPSYYSSGPSISDLAAIGFDGQIKVPHEDYYLPDYRYGYIFDCDYGLNVRVYRNPDNGIASSNMLPKAWHGSEVTMLAKRHDFYCIIYYTELNQICAGWVHEDNLKSSFPGDWYSVGTKNKELFAGEYYTVNPAEEWSDEFYPGTYSEFCRVWGPGSCFSLTLEYQVIGRNDKKAYGEHDVYYLTDGQWKYANSLTVKEDLDTVRYTLYFNYPVTVQAVAVLPAERNQQGFDFRLCVPEMCYTLD